MVKKTNSKQASALSQKKIQGKEESKQERYSSELLAERICAYLDEYQATDISCLDVRTLTSVTDFMIICSGRSLRHIQSVAERLSETLELQYQIPTLHIEGIEKNSNWILIDFVDVIVHVMLQEAQYFYDLEKLWAQTSAISEKCKPSS